MRINYQDRMRSQKIFILFFMIGVFLYFQSLLSVCFQYDDRSTIIGNPAIRDLFNIPAIWQNFNTRFIVGLSFALNYYFSGLNVFAYRLVNITAHIATSFLVYRLLATTVALPYFKEKPVQTYGPEISFFAGLIFLCHPLQTEPVNFITQRFVIFATFFYLLAILLYVKARQKNSIEYYLLCFVSIICAMYSKEIAVTLPIAIVVYEIFFLGHLRLKPKQYFLIFIPILLTLFIIPATLLQTSTMTAPTARIASISNNVQPLNYKVATAMHTVDISKAGGPTLKRSEYFFTELNVAVTYLRLLILPINQNLVYDYPFTRNFFNVRTILCLILLFLFGLVAAYIYRKHRLLSFCIIWFFLTLSVESTFIPISHVIAEYRLYLALFSFAAALCVTVFMLFKEKFRWARIVLSIIVFVLCVLTWQRNQVWRTETSLWEDIVKKSPRSAKAHTNLGIIYAADKKYQQAIEQSIEALELDNHNLDALITIGYAKLNLQDFHESLRIFKDVVSADSNNAVAYHGMGICYLKLNRPAEAIKYLDLAVNLDPMLKEAYAPLILLYMDSHQETNIEGLIKRLLDLKYYEMAKYVQIIYDELRKG